MKTRDYNSSYEGSLNRHSAFPMGGIGTGCLCLDGQGALQHASIRHRPEMWNSPGSIAAVHAGDDAGARVLEGPLPDWKTYGPANSEAKNPWLFWLSQTGLGNACPTGGLPSFANSSITARFPFAEVCLQDDDYPLEASVTGWSPFVPPDSDDSSLPCACLDYKLTNKGNRERETTFSFHLPNFLYERNDKPRWVDKIDGGFLISQQTEGSKNEIACLLPDEKQAIVNPAWFRGGHYDTISMLWKGISENTMAGAEPFAGDDAPSPGGSVLLRFSLKPGESKAIRVLLTWRVPEDKYRYGGVGAESSDCSCSSGYQPYYATRFSGIGEQIDYLKKGMSRLYEKSRLFADTLASSTLPPEVSEAVQSNLCILKSPTLLRQQDGRLWMWEGCCSGHGCCEGSCTHVWNYAQATCHLFPDLERGLRETEHFDSQNDEGHQDFRASLPIGPTPHKFGIAADGQLGGIIKVYRDWRISGDDNWLKNLWPRVKQSLHYCIEHLDPDGEGWTREPHHNTYDIEFWGPNGMITSIYLHALQAAVLMGNFLKDSETAKWEQLLEKGIIRLEKQLFNGEYFIQKIIPQDKHGRTPVSEAEKSLGALYSDEAIELLKQEGPKYQYGDGCLSDGIVGAWFAACAGLPGLIDPEKVSSHLRSVFRHNFKPQLQGHVNPQRCAYAMPDEGGLLLCTWNEKPPSLPFIYSNEVWTGIEYQVASHMIRCGMTEEGLQIVRTCRDRYNSGRRNPFDEYECGHWYGRALASYDLLHALSGARYDAKDRGLHLCPRIEGDFTCFFCTAKGYGLVGVKDAKPFLKTVEGEIPCREINYQPFQPA